MPEPDVTWEFHSHSERDTERLGEMLSGAVAPGTVIGLIGDLGAGKTRLVQAFATSMGVNRREVTSPTFVLIQEYEGRLPIFHFDTYRLRSVNEFLELGAEEYFTMDGVCFVEWGDRVNEVLPSDCLRVSITPTADTERIFRIEASGPVSRRIVESLSSIKEP